MQPCDIDVKSIAVSVSTGAVVRVKSSLYKRASGWKVDVYVGDRVIVVPVDIIIESDNYASEVRSSVIASITSALMNLGYTALGGKG